MAVRRFLRFAVVSVVATAAGGCGREAAEVGPSEPLPRAVIDEPVVETQTAPLAATTVAGRAERGDAESETAESATPARPAAEPPQADSDGAPPSGAESAAPVVAPRPAVASAETEPAPKPEWLRVADELQARRATVKPMKNAMPFDGPPGNGRRGAHGLLVRLPASAGAGRSDWRFDWEWSDTARGVHVVHPFRTGHVLVLIYRDYVAVFPGGDWSHDEYLGESSHPVRTTDAYDAAFPLPAKKPVKIVSRLDADGRYALLVGGREVLTARIDAAEPLRLPDSFKGEKLPAPWPAGSAGVVVGPVDTGVNRVSKVELLATTADSPLADYRQPVPDDEAQRAALKEIRELLAGDYAKARDAGSKRALARKLHDLALETRRDPDARFVMLREAKDLAAETLDVDRLSAAIDALDRRYAVDASRLTRDALKEMARDVTTPQEGGPVVSRALDLSEKAVRRDDFDAALDFVTAASIAATRMRDDALLDAARERRREIEDLRVRSAEAAEAQAVLNESPDDPQANRTLGGYLLFARGDWKRGLPLLAKCDDEPLRSLAERELANVRTPEALVALGDAWYDASESRTGRDRTDFRRRAAAWYRQAVEKVTGLTRERVKKRLEELGAAE